jgi:hypothetical protein
MLFHSEEHHDFNRGTHDHSNLTAPNLKIYPMGHKAIKPKTGPKVNDHKTN